MFLKFGTANSIVGPKKKPVHFTVRLRIFITLSHTSFVASLACDRANQLHTAYGLFEFLFKFVTQNGVEYCSS